MKHLLVRIKTLDSNSKFEIDNAEVFSTDKILYIQYIEPTSKANVLVSFDAQGVNIERTSEESKTIIQCALNRKTQATMRTPYGEQFFEVKTQEIINTKDSLTVNYELYTGDLLIQKAQVYYQYNERGLN